MSYSAESGMFYGVDPVLLRAWLVEAYQAQHELMTGKKTVTLSYAMGQGARSVTYAQADVAKLRAYIDQLKAALGVGRRRAIGVCF